MPNGGSTVYSASGDALRAAALNQNPFVESDVNPDDSYSAPSPPSEVTQTVYGWVQKQSTLGTSMGRDPVLFSFHTDKSLTRWLT